MRVLVIAVTFGVATLGSCTMVGRGSDDEQLSRVEIQDALNGRTLQQRLSDGEMGLISFDEDGSVTLTSDDGGPTVGRWRASDEGLCLDWRRPQALPEQCYEMRMLAVDAYQLSLPDGRPYLTMTVPEQG